MEITENAARNDAKPKPNAVIDEQVTLRRQKLNDAIPPNHHQRLPDGAGDKWGLALSGGGIRSATFCFGLLRALANQKTLLRFDLMSTVSGGGYIGTMLGCLFNRAKDGKEALQVEEAIDGQQHQHTQPHHSGQASSNAVAEKPTAWFLWWLRANGRYLIPRGVRDTSFAFALYVRNLAGIHLELGLIAVSLGLLLALLDLFVWGVLRTGGFLYASSTYFDTLSYLPSWCPTVALLLPFFAIAAARIASAYWAVPWVHASLRRTTAPTPAAPPATNTSSAGPATPPASKLTATTGFWVTCAVVLIFDILFGYAFYRFGLGTSEDGDVLRRVVWVTIVGLVALWVAGSLKAKSTLQDQEPKYMQAPPLLADAARNKLTKQFATRLRWMLAIVVIGLIDRMAWQLAFGERTLLNVGLSLGIAAAILRGLAPLASNASSKGQSSPIMSAVVITLGRVAGYGLTFLLVSWWVSIVYQTVLGALFTTDGLKYAEAGATLFFIALPTAGYLLWTGSNLTFLNLSSLHSFYRARLVRSYMGAANAERFQQPHPLGALNPVGKLMPTGKTNTSIDDVSAGDDISLSNYRPQDSGGPVHLINVCINQTQDPRGNMFNQDRRGLPLCVASGGLIKESQDDWKPESHTTGLSVGRWMAISGAAFSTGMGAGTKGGITALMTFAGVRLGYWWGEAERTGQPKRSPLLTKSKGLIDELFGNFQGTAGSDWFLSDGGHFENTAAYALLAQRAKVIVVADCGADPDYTFGDLENLVRIARVDLQAEIRFQRPNAERRLPDELSAFGRIGDLASDKSTACLALARVAYGGTDPASEGILILIKPNICAGLPVDLLNFKRQYEDFPQQTTADQFFSEAQWESYFLLGQFLGGHLRRDFIERLIVNKDVWFQDDERSPFEKAKGSNNEEPAALISRLPERIVARSAAVGTTIGLGAAATLGVSTWQAIDGLRSSYSKTASEQHAALKEIADLWARVPAAAYQEPRDEKDSIALDKLAAAIVRTADTLCPSNEADWYRQSPLATVITKSAIEKCKAVPSAQRGSACQALIEASIPELKSTLPKCLGWEEQRKTLRPPPYYWVYDYSATGIIDNWHPCDRRRNELAEREAAYKLPSAFGRIEVPKTAPNYGKTERVLAGCRIPRADRTQDEREAIEQHPYPSFRVQLAQLVGLDVFSLTKLTQAGTTTIASTQPTAVGSAAPPPPPPAPVSSSPDVGLAAANTPARPLNASCSRPELTPAQEAIRGACKDVRVFIQTYGFDPQKQAALSCYRDAWSGVLQAAQLPVEDVVQSARRRGRPDPVPVQTSTIRFHGADSMDCALDLADIAGRSGDWRVEPLSSRLKAERRTLEVWIAPTDELKPPASAATPPVPAPVPPR